ncbi:hypothetical protein OIU77_029185 [Salix suchowensis]|uniref:Poly [ADP-ribose] polymerase n=1 Tax=Salix suchowensis TaxID=1278906 RepID=A0ABQ9BME7_9ROSI|nr:hypothetical protein OIU77_029185 [Salix suchowensis]
MKVHETRSQAHAPSDESRIMTRKQKVGQSKVHEGEQSQKKKAKNGKDQNDSTNGKSEDKIAKEYEEFCKVIEEHLSVEQMREILDMDEQDSSSGSDGVVTTKCQDVLFFGPLDKCPLCSSNLEFDGKRYSCKGFYSEWSSCTFKTRTPPRKEEPLKLPDSVLNSSVAELLKKHQDPSRRPCQGAPIKHLAGILVSLSGRLSRTHQYWKREIEKHGGKVSSSVEGITCLVVSPTERERSGSTKLANALEAGIPVVKEEWLLESIEKQEPRPMEAYVVVSDLSVEGKGIPWDRQDPSEEPLESISTELKLYGKRGVYKDTRLQERGGQIFEKDGILYSRAFSLCDLGRGLNEYCIMQLITVPDSNLHSYYKKGKVGDDANAVERLEEWENVDSAIKEFVRLFEELTGNEFEPWEREKKFEKKRLCFYPIDMDDGVDVRHGGLGLKQPVVAAAHSSLEPKIAYFMKILCSQEIYKYAMMEMGLDSPDLPMGMLSDLHLERCEEVLLQFVKAVKSMKETGQKAEAVWSDYSQRWFTLLHSTRPFIFRDYQDLADHGAAFETIRDINVASRLVGDMSGSALDDPLSDRYEKLGCSVSALEKESDDYRMIMKYLETTYEPVRVGDMDYGVAVENIFAVEPSACPLDEIKKLTNKVLLWCGTRCSSMLRHLQKGFLPSVCSLPVPGYMFGKAIVSSDAAAEAARCGFTAVDRPKGFFVLAVVSLGDQIIEVNSPPEDTKSLEEKKLGVKGWGKKKTDESEHFIWKDDIKVPCGRLIPSEHGDSPLEYNEYAVYDPKQTSIRFLVEVKYEEMGAALETAEP